MVILNCDHHYDGVSITIGADIMVLLQGDTQASIAIRRNEPRLVHILSNDGEV